MATSSSSLKPVPTSTSLRPLPTGCAGHFPGPNTTPQLDDSFSGTYIRTPFRTVPTAATLASAGCTTGLATLLQVCCATVGSVPVFSHQTCGCPFNNATFPPSDEHQFFDCVDGYAGNSVSVCNPRKLDISAAATVHGRRHGAHLLCALILGALLGFGCAGV
ncbi:hypothetical protein C8R46DRAFT_1128168 [Mycena filopes]|nr:hypothetical protein C8R46DRAFT_1128168 [Mycena filopes]